MSLDVYLETKPSKVECVCAECGHKHEADKSERLFSANITHNLCEMANEAGIEKQLWAPHSLHICRARDLIAPLSVGLECLRSDPERFKKFNPKNGWGNYEALVTFVDLYLEACREYPDAVVSVSA